MQVFDSSVRLLRFRKSLKEKRITLRESDMSVLQKRALKLSPRVQKREIRKSKGTSFLQFHPDELPYIDSLLQEHLNSRDLLLQFFSKGGVETTLFTNNIAPYLTVGDMVQCAKTGKSLHRLCRTYTVPELLRTKPLELSRDHRVQLGCDVMKQVTAYGSRKERPTRITILSPSECFRAKLYHPQELDQVNILIDKYMALHGTPKVLPSASNSTESETALVDDSEKNESSRTQGGQGNLEDTPVLVSTVFGPRESSVKRGTDSNSLDVTGRIKELVVTEGGGHRLVLVPPPIVRNAHGSRKRAPTTMHYWYTRLFGDPCPRTTKVLLVTVCDPVTRKNTTFKFEENQVVDIPLTIEP